MGKLSVNQIFDAHLNDWRLFRKELHARFSTGDFKTGAAFVAAITDVAEEANHHPDVTLTYPWVDVRLTSHDVAAITDRDISLAGSISALAAQMRIESDLSNVVHPAIGLDCTDFAAVGRFWAVVLTGTAEAFDGDAEVVDPNGRIPSFWLQQTAAHEQPRQRFHLDLWVPAEQLDDRIAAAVAAGGTMVDQSHKPSFVVLADPEGNKVCLCTTVSGDY